jgi:tRNA (cmo5U34)-methyltransferase
MADYRFVPEVYLESMLEEIPGYEELQEETVRATEGMRAARILELGTGTGETARRVLARHPDAHLVGIDSSCSMLEEARHALPDADLRVGRLEDPLPEGPFDLVFSALAVHHLDAAGKADLFRRVAAALEPGGRFVLADVVVPERSEDAVIPCTPGFDLPDSVPDQLAWLEAAGLEPRVAWAQRDLAVIPATLRRRRARSPSRSRARARAGSRASPPSSTRRRG